MPVVKPYSKNRRPAMMATMKGATRWALLPPLLMTVASSDPIYVRSKEITAFFLPLPDHISSKFTHRGRIRADAAFSVPRAPFPTMPPSSALRVGTGLTFDDGDQILVSAQKPLGILLEETVDGMGCVVIELSDPESPVSRAGVRPGDRLVAVQNIDTTGSITIEEVLERIAAAPRVVNLRFRREVKATEGVR
uniref:PDZ domain-containing protein n=1 Tax=Trieres chinensis TaxID=1514140 RepID=A0A7S2EQV1_TRICV